MTMPYPKRLIEVDLPIKRISAHARREKSIRHGHISTLHIWWARRPLAACRAVICASLWPDPVDQLCPQAFREDAVRHLVRFARKSVSGEISIKGMSSESFSRWRMLSSTNHLDLTDANHLMILRGALLDFIADFANWDNSGDASYLETSRALTESAHLAMGGQAGTRSLVVDPFAGGGAIPMEALRVGADTFASDLSPVSVVLNKVVIEYIPKFGVQLAHEVRTWGSKIRNQVETDLRQFYPGDPDGSVPIAYIWARTILSDAPDDGTGIPTEIPLIRSLWLAKRKKGSVALRWVRDNDNKVRTEVSEIRYADGTKRTVQRPLLELFLPASDRDVGPGTVQRGAATCPVTGHTVPVTRVRGQLKLRKGGTNDSRLLCVVLKSRDRSGRRYRVPNPTDSNVTNHAASHLERLKQETSPDSSYFPDLAFSGLEPRRIPLPQYGIDSFSELFSPRQTLTLVTFASAVKQLGPEIVDSLGLELGRAVQTCLALAVDRIVDQLSTLVGWVASIEVVTHTFTRQALPMVWDFVEANPFAGAGADFLGAIEWVSKVCEREGVNLSGEGVGFGSVQLVSATDHTLPSDIAEAFITDPPYYFSIPYSDLADYFYIWLRMMIGDIHPDLFSTPVLRDLEVVQNLPHSSVANIQKSKQFFEDHLALALAEAQRICKIDGIGVVVFAHTETDAWESLVGALVGAGIQVTASWPIDTERAARVIAQRQSTLGSSIHLVCRPRATSRRGGTAAIGEWRDVLGELPSRIHEWLPRLAAEGVVGADAIFACLGPALEIFSRYERVEKSNGEPVDLRQFFEQVWAAVAREALALIFAGADASGLEEDARLTAMWLWTLAAGVQDAVDGATEFPVEAAEVGDEEVLTERGASAAGFSLEFDAARKFAQGLGAHLDRLGHLVEVKGSTARLLSVGERTRYLFGKDEVANKPARRGGGPRQLDLFGELAQAEEETTFGASGVPRPGRTALDKVHQAMILFGAGRADGLKRFVVELGVGQEPAFWSLAQSLSALYPVGTEEKRWVDGVLARKKGLGF